ncbi:Polysaccharide pyruvyl transferase family protein WcaK [Halopseudomonas xinjiangensis]|uniref:Polysaccharide pyruvyl transferase family protein WcaK n=1 Tax=Halopseudomonas xinjiangensis TaxID=487184 RepID=A0A1H1NL97_9GAMM|nr:polysaccharide pyruvyl transferase family protein [Halopseudomonas xinjiangensis]SDR99640.1 Polysaccharide pyruvyl transferase family protein WcaK [Halopseudomonas xinjiangensis]
METAPSNQPTPPVREKPSLYYVANTQNENLGDIVINLLLIEQCAKLFNVTVNVRNCPPHYIEAIRKTECFVVDSGHFSFVSAMIYRSIRRNRTYFFQKPGHFFGDEEGLKKTLVRTVSFLGMRCAGVRMVRVGASIGPFRTTVETMLEKLQASLHALYTVRESYSMTYCRAKGLPSSFCPDMAFLLTSRQPGLARYGYCLSFRDMHLEGEHPATALSAMELLSQHSRLAVVTQVERDHAFNHDLSSRCNAEIHVGFNGSNADEIFAIYNVSTVTLSNRLHVLLFAAAQGSIPVPVIDRAKQTKIAGIFEDLGLSYLIFDLSDEKPLDQHLEGISNQEAQIRSALTTAYQRNSQLISDALAYLSQS